MVSYLLRFLTKLKPCLIFSLFIIVILTLTANLLLLSFKNTIVQTINKYSFKPVGIGKAYYLPPNFVILTDIIIRQDTLPQKKIINIPILRIDISLLHLVLNRQVHILSLHCYAPNTDYPDFALFLKENFTQILNLLRKLPKQDIGLFIKGMQFWFSKNNKNPDNIEADFAIRIKNGLLLGSGLIKQNIYKAGVIIPLRYRFKGKLNNNGIVLDKLELAKENLYCELTGSLDENIFEFKGSMLLNTLFNENLYPDTSLGIFEKIHLLFSDPFSESIGLLKPNLYILDIDSRINLTYPNLQIERLEFLINNNPVRLKGKILLEAPFSCALNFYSRFKSLENTRPAVTKDISINTSLDVENNELNLSGTFNIDFLGQEKDRLPLKKVGLGVTGLSFTFGESPLLKMRLGKLDFLGITDVNTYRIVLDDLNIEFSKLDDRVKYLKFYSRFYGGALEGAGNLEIKGFMPIITVTAKVKGADANKLDGILIHFSKTYGKLDIKMLFLNYPELQLKGNLMINNGYLKDFEFFKWLADLFDLPTLKKIPFQKASSNFVIDEKGSSLFDMDLDSSDVKLNGNFKLGEGDSVSSRMSLSFSRPLINTSSKLKPLLRLLHDENEFSLLNFDFKLSGNLHKMNFQWLQSDFKRKFMLAIPNFVERRIERNMEDIIKSISKE